ncbi:biotin biosynthesis protein BioY [Paenibacillus darwinianus]|uniref:Biotin transporter n=1 Tax=Paenibacillus darwinianus TaxID=1380763 RepID=A0A9W5W878_9BACL|nr:biotin transporter BioY [Paenibacillus darwinianus]EXX91158.1 biotin biosynthesis protein BioY [Paenibacillus darwinianus]EXX92061.1 biotin biosynthesis protein BioY [Paenibacillus darwinianus]EXX92777.1 biotin biosynthesis protein BioY [Paenibacillus darwinianus]
MSIRHLVYTALFAALFVAMSAVTIPLGFSPVPITLQNFALMLAGAFLGARYGFLSIGIVVALVALGLPLLHGQGGIGYIKGGTGGFILMFPICTLAVGYFTGKLFKSNIRRQSPVLFYFLLFLSFEVFGSLLSYVGGVPWLAAVYNWPFSKAMALGAYPYLAGDAAKAVVATVVTGALQAYVPVWKRKSSSQLTGLPAAADN